MPNGTCQGLPFFVDETLDDNIQNATYSLKCISIGHWNTNCPDPCGDRCLYTDILYTANGK